MFEDRHDAGRRLGARLRELALDVSVVLGLPRGGVPVAAQVARMLELPLDVIIVRKLGLPRHPEVAMGAIGEAGVRMIDRVLVEQMRVTSRQIETIERQERETLERRVTALRGDRGRLDLTGRRVLIVDDGIATGATASAACRAARALGASHVVVAAPIGGPRAAEQVSDADRVICLEQPAEFHAVGAYYRQFDQTSDVEVAGLLRAAPGRHNQRDQRWAIPDSNR